MFHKSPKFLKWKSEKTWVFKPKSFWISVCKLIIRKGITGLSYFRNILRKIVITNNNLHNLEKCLKDCLKITAILTINKTARNKMNLLMKSNEISKKARNKMNLLMLSNEINKRARNKMNLLMKSNWIIKIKTTLTRKNRTR